MKDKGLFVYKTNLIHNAFVAAELLPNHFNNAEKDGSYVFE